MFFHQLRHSPPMRITSVYLLAASAWILLSDTALIYLGMDDATLATLGTLKGMLFVLLTGTLLYVHLRREFTLRYQVEAALKVQVQEVQHSREALAQSEKRFRKAVEEAPLPIMIFAEDGEVLAISRTWLDITGYPREVLTTLDRWTRSAYGTEASTVRAVIQRLFELDSRVDEGEFNVTCADGTQRIWSFSSTPLGRLTDNRRVAISIASDVTERHRMDSELHRVNQFLETLIQASPVGIVMFTLDDIVKVWNPAAERLLGWSAEEILGQTLPYVRPQDRESFNQLKALVARGQTFMGVDAQRQRKDGSVADLNISAGPLYDIHGRVTGVVGIVIDITERRRIEEALRESELRFRQLVQEAPAGIFVQTEGQFAYINPTAAHLFNVESESDLLGRPVLEMFHPDSHAQIRARIHQLNHERRAVPRVVETFLKADGTPFEVEVSAVPITFNDKQGALVFFQDITERRRIEEALRESELRFRQLAENIKEVFYLNDAQKRQMLYISPMYEQVWGRTRESLYTNPQSFVEAIYPADREKVTATFAAQREGKSIEVMYRIVRPDRGIRWIRSRAFPIMDEQGGFTRIAGIAEDITELVKSQNKLKRLSRRLMRVLDEERARIARELHDQVGQELTGLGINLQIMAIHCGQIPAAQAVLDDSKALVSTIIERIRVIIADLRPLVLDDMGLPAGLRWYCERFTRRSGIAVKLDVLADVAYLNPAVSNTLYQIVQEALTNVIKHAQATTVWVSLKADDHLVTLTVRDDGVGFDASSVLSDNYSSRWGLRIMQERVQTVMGARLSIESARGQGTQITVEVQL